MHGISQAAIVSLLRRLTAAERVIMQSAMEEKGVFAEHRTWFWNGKDDGIILSDGKYLYPLGSMEEVPTGLPLDGVSGILGPAPAARKLLRMYPSLSFTMEKDFAFLEDQNALPSLALPVDCTIVPAEKEDAIQAFCKLKAHFLAEEADDEPPPFAPMHPATMLPTKPVILLWKNDAVGMVSSNFYSSESAMINMLFLRPDVRGKGWGKAFLVWYTHYLLRESKAVCLFYSPDNEPAKRLYGGLGFRKSADWLMAIQQ